ncbi:hypothetical protein BHE74_00055890 [Ensete ventricosum]|uniref:Uncharacterized protein n=1 Tax=Ensete ventricosum TaxID=4639 RepID=A0A444D377_ENSVE|nr:hypothetical protein GW17_00045002 [Ensete ventricosum]RWW38841.1 hypothetical protein BHE74_00055890 [Ensete ventricosum]RZR73984.1 hypothetical protein BHM03_00030394 [Ensete ventricosum]
MSSGLGMCMAKKRKSSLRPVKASNGAPQHQYVSRHFPLMLGFVRSIELAKLSKGELPEKIWIKAVILAADCNPRWLTKHIPSLASSTRVPMILVKDNKSGSLRLGELVKLKTAMAIGIKVNTLFPHTLTCLRLMLNAKGSRINETVDEILGGATSSEDTLEMARQIHT